MSETRDPAELATKLAQAKAHCKWYQLKAKQHKDELQRVRAKAEKMATWIIAHETPTSTETVVDQAMEIVDHANGTAPPMIPARLRYKDGKEEQVEIVGIPKIEYGRGMKESLAGDVTYPKLSRCGVVYANLTFEDSCIYGMFEINADVVIEPPQKIVTDDLVISHFRSVGHITSARQEGEQWP